MEFQKIKITYYSPLVILLIVVVSFYPSFDALVSVWVIWDQSMSHGIPVAALFVYLLWRSLPWDKHLVSVLERSFLAVLLLLFSFFWAVFYLIKIKILHEICVLPIYITALAFVFGLKAIWHHRILLLLPIYIIPLGEFINDYLVSLSSVVVSELVKLAGIPAYIDGNNIQIPSGRIVIAQGCSGLRYLTISLCLAHTISYLNGYKERGLLVCLFFAGLIGLIANWLRIFILICIGYLSEMQSPLMADHDTFGWLLFGGICLTAIFFAPIVKTHNSKRSINSGEGVIAILSMSLVLLTPAPTFAYLTAKKAVPPLVPMEVSGNRYSVEVDAMPAEPLLPQSTNRYTYRSIDGVYIRLDEYVPHTTQSQLVPYIPHLINEDIWAIKAASKIPANDKKFSWTILHSSHNEKTVGQIQWFNVGGYQVESVNKAKLYQIPAVINNKIYFKVVTLQSVCSTSSCDDVYELLINESKSDYWH